MIQTIVNCEICGKTLKRTGLGAHKRISHGIRKEGPAKEISASPRPPLAEGEGVKRESPPLSQKAVTFTSPRSSALRIVIVPSAWVQINTPVGLQQIKSEGKTVEFFDGVFTTSDEEVINYLENVYKDDRYPVFSNKKLAGLGHAS